MRGFVADDPATPTHPLLDARVVRLPPPEFPFDEAFSDAVPGVVDGPVDVPTVLCGSDIAASYVACVQEADLMRRPLRDVGIHRRALRLWHRSQRSDHAPSWAAGYPAMQITDIAEFRNALQLAVWARHRRYARSRVSAAGGAGQCGLCRTGARSAALNYPASGLLARAAPRSPRASSVTTHTGTASAIGRIRPLSRNPSRKPPRSMVGSTFAAMPPARYTPP